MSEMRLIVAGAGGRMGRTLVKAIAEENGVKMPGFFGYMGYAIAILIPIFIAATFLFFR